MEAEAKAAADTTEAIAEEEANLLEIVVKMASADGGGAMADDAEPVHEAAAAASSAAVAARQATASEGVATAAPEQSHEQRATAELRKDFSVTNEEALKKQRTCYGVGVRWEWQSDLRSACADKEKKATHAEPHPSVSANQSFGKTSQNAEG